MASMFVAPSRASLVASSLNSGSARFQQFLFRGEIRFPFDQVREIQGAMLGMQERAAEGIAEGTNRAAARVREELIQATADISNIPRDRIAESIRVRGEATEDSPAVAISMFDTAEPLIEFGPVQDQSGVNVSVYRGQARQMFGSFIQRMPDGREGEFKRQRGAGRYPIHERFGPSVRDVFTDHPELLERETDNARVALVEEISEVRDEIVHDFTTQSNLLSSFSPTAGRLVSFVAVPLRIANRIFG